jgi:parallel beta-helix repeat protein
MRWIAHSLLALIVAPLPLACSACSSGSTSQARDPLCTGKGRCIAISPSWKEQDIAAAFATAKDDDTIAFAPGTFAFTNQLALGTANGVSIVGAGPDKTTLDFHGQKAGEDSLFAQSVSNLRFEGFRIKDPPGNGAKVLRVTGITFRSVAVTWTAMDKTDGAYGLYPVQSSEVLIEHCTLRGASDSGIYVGQSQDIVVRYNEASGNVGGIEIENSFSADVHDNSAHDNTAGILVFDLPGLQQEGGHAIRVYANELRQNNTPNFAAAGDIVSIVPAGTGFVVMANHDVELFGNTFDGNETLAVGIVSYAVTLMSVSDPNYTQWPSRVYVHDNTYTGNGAKPDPTSTLGQLLATGQSVYPGGHVPDIVYDGIVPNPMQASSNPMQICIQEVPATPVCNAHFDQLDLMNPDLSKTTVCGAAPFACSLPALPAVSFGGLTP